MELITFGTFCAMLNTTVDLAIDRRRKYRDISYIKKGMAPRNDHHLMFSAMSISPLLDIKTIFEIGTCAGNCCRMLALLFPDAQITTIDINEKSSDAEHANELLNNYSNVQRLYIDSQCLHNDNTDNYDCIFVDGCHKFPVVASDIDWAYKHSNNIIVFDDVSSVEPDVVKALEDLDKTIPDTIYLVETSSGLANLGLIIKRAL